MCARSALQVRQLRRDERLIPVRQNRPREQQRRGGSRRQRLDSVLPRCSSRTSAEGARHDCADVGAPPRGVP